MLHSEVRMCICVNTLLVLSEYRALIVWLTCLTFELRDTERRLPTVCPR